MLAPTTENPKTTDGLHDDIALALWAHDLGRNLVSWDDDASVIYARLADIVMEVVERYLPNAVATTPDCGCLARR